MNRASMLVTVVIASAVLAGCSGVGDSAAPGSSASRSASAAASGDSSASADPSGPPSTEPADPGTSPSPSQGGQGPSADITVTGAVEGGVEMNCLLLRTTATTYLLIGGDRSKLVVGRHVTVRGRVEQGLISTCQQGTPLRVSDIQTG